MEVLSCFDLSSNRFTHWCAVLESLARFIFCVVLSMEKDSGLIKKKLKYSSRDLFQVGSKVSLSF